MSLLATGIRTHTCGDIQKESIGSAVVLSGWVSQRRDLGNLIFLVIRDQYGTVQVVCDPEKTKDVHAVAEKLRSEWVVRITGTVQEKEDKTGKEIRPQSLEVLNQSLTPPFELKNEVDVKNEDLRLEYRYLDLRRERMQRNLSMRHHLVHWIRNYFYEHRFTDIETPILVKGTPEGSREYIVPSRLHPEKFYVLPQSPQQLKQLLMVGGVDRYFQIARCFRDEDLRGDRQPEFTQFEIEMSFCTQEDILNVIEGCFQGLMEFINTKKDELRWNIQPKNYTQFLENGRFRRITWKDAMTRFGSDKPDMRFGLELQDVSSIAHLSGFGVFENAEYVSALSVPKDVQTFSRKDIDTLTQLAQHNGAKGLAWYRFGEESGAIAKNTTHEFQNRLQQQLQAHDGDMVFFGAGGFIEACEPLGSVRLHIAQQSNLINATDYAFVWVLDFPLFETKKDGSFGSAHHPFTRPHTEDIEKLKTDPLSVLSHAYDIVLNGVELGGGSLRIHQQSLQHLIFEVLGMDEAEIQMKFGHMMKAFQYGCPPHGGCAMGLDRVIMMMSEEPNIREVIAFPKNQSAQDLMLGSPSAMPLAELHEQNIDILQR